MTNSEAFMVYFPDSDRADLVLANKSITPAGTEDNPVSSAWGMIEAATAPDYSQGRTSEKLSSGARRQLIKNAQDILKANGIYWNPGTTPIVTSSKW